MGAKKLRHSYKCTHSRFHVKIKTIIWSGLCTANTPVSKKPETLQPKVLSNNFAIYIADVNRENTNHRVLENKQAPR